MLKPHFKFPVVSRGSHNGFVLNKYAYQLLTQDNERFVAVIREEDGTISLQPLQLPQGTLTVVHIWSGNEGDQGGSPHVSAIQGAADYPRGRYRAIWDDVGGKLRIMREGPREE